jgi:hypothetical protein
VVQTKYLNITREETIKFLKSQSTYQLTYRPPIKQRPLKKYFRENHAWAIDLIDLNYYAGSNRGFKYIMSIIDVFSRQVILKPLKNKEGNTISRVLDNIFQDKKPKLLFMDNGGEFVNNFTNNLYTQYNIKAVKQPSHTPQPNIEQLNGFIRLILSKTFVQTKLFNWIDYIEDIEAKINITNKIEKDKENPPENPPRNHQIIKPLFKVGDIVKIKAIVYDANARKEIKAQNQKLQHAKYSNNNFTITQVMKPSGNSGISRYVLKDNKNDIVYQLENGRKQIFREIDLQRLEKIDTKHSLTTKQINKLNDNKYKKNIHEQIVYDETPVQRRDRIIEDNLEQHIEARVLRDGTIVQHVNNRRV